jgi:hypothetical protein
MDIYESAPPGEDLKYVDVLSEFEDHDVSDAVKIYSIPVSHLAPLGHLGRHRAADLLRFTRDKILGPLGLLDTGHHQDCVEVISVRDSSVEPVMKTEEDSASVELVMKTEENSVELVVKTKGDSIESIVDVSKSTHESAISDDSSVFSAQLTQEEHDAILQWQERVGGEDSGESEIENEDATVLYSDVDDVAEWFGSSHEV